MEHMPGHTDMGAKNRFGTLFIMCTRKVSQICEHKQFFGISRNFHISITQQPKDFSGSFKFDIKDKYPAFKR